MYKFDRKFKKRRKNSISFAVLLWSLLLIAIIVIIIVLFSFFKDYSGNPLKLISSPSSSDSLLTCKQQLPFETCTKIGQMLIVGFGGLSQDENGRILWEDPNGTYFKENSNIAQEIKNQHIGGVIFYNRPFRQNKTQKFIRYRNIENPEQVASLAQALKKYSREIRKSQNLEDLELIISIDQEGGMINRLPTDQGFQQTSILPQAFGANEELALSKKQNAKNPNSQKQKALEQTYGYAQKMAQELNKLQFNVNFAPCVDVNINPLNYVLGGRGRCFSSNPEVVTDQASVFIKAFQESGIIATLKHFPGHGSSSNDTHVGLVDVTQTFQKESELKPYQQLIKQGFQDFIMTTHVINGQLDKTQCKPGDSNDPKTWCPGTMSQATLTTLLRETLGFKGVILSDDMAMGAIAKEYPLDIALEKAINAGVDMFIISNNYSNQTLEVINTIAKLVKEGRVKESEIDRAYQNIVTLKQRMREANPILLEN